MMDVKKKPNPPFSPKTKKTPDIYIPSPPNKLPHYASRTNTKRTPLLPENNSFICFRRSLHPESESTQTGHIVERRGFYP